MRVFLDACVLYPPIVRGLVLDCAAEGLFRPFWSPRVLDEWRIAVARKQGSDAEAAAMRARDAMTACFGDAEVPAEQVLEEALALPDPADAHVLAAAAAAGADVLLTFNLRDFPARSLASHGMAPRHPDGFLWELHGHAPERLHRLATARLGEVRPDDLRRALKRARLPRLGKALASAG